LVCRTDLESASHYITENRACEIAQAQVTSDDIQKNLIVTKNQKIYHLDETNQLVATNSGIVKAFNIRHAVDIIKENPVGPKVSDQFVDWPKRQ
jgi:hypothetical protein